MTTVDLTDLSATEAAAAIRRRDVSATALVETLDLEGAYRQANALDKELEAGHLRGPLHGLPIGVKDIFYTAGLSTRGGSPIYRDFVPSYDATAVRRLRRAGAIELGKTTATQFAYLDPTPTRNPWNLQHTPGGSSSGAAIVSAWGGK